MWMYVMGGVIFLNESITCKRKEQIHVVLNQGENEGHVGRKEHFFINESERKKHDYLDKIENEIEDLVGMKVLKHLIQEMYACLYINKCRQDHGLKVE